VLALAAACTTPAPPTAAPGGAASTSGFPRTVVDGAGRSIRLAAKPMRIVSQTLASDEILFAIVAPDRLVGLSTLSRDPKYSNVVAAASAHTAPAIETAEDALRLRPDLIIVATYSRAEVVQNVEATGAPVYRLASFDDIDGIMANVGRLGEAVGEPDAAARLVAEMRRRLAAVEARRAGRPKPRVLSYSGGFTAGRGTSFDDIVRRAGGVNEAAARGIDGFPKVNAEQVLAWNPDVLVAGYLPGEAESVRRRLTTSPGIAETTAARRGQIVLLETRTLLAVSQYTVDAVEMLADRLDGLQAAP
jgi:iron complex transport system substrate-binding protein